MDRQEATKALMRAGKLDELNQILEDWTQKAARSYEAIRSDTTRSEEYTRWSLAVSCTRLLRDLTDELVRKAETVVRADRDDAARVFGIQGLPGDVASLTISRRDAADRVSSLTRDELRDVLARATRSGDEVLARAVAERAMEFGDDKTLSAFVETRPHLDAAVERMWNAERAAGESIAVSMAISGMRPAELSSMGYSSIEGLALNEPGAA